MQKAQEHFDFIPVKIYESPSSIYLTCISKLPRDCIPPECDLNLVVEQAMVSGLDQELTPEDFQKRQQEAREILLKSQDLIVEMGLVEDTSDEVESGSMEYDLTNDDSEEGLREPVRLISEILINQYKKLYEPKPNPKPKPTLKELLPLGEIKSYLSLILSFMFMLCSLSALILCGHENYFL